MTKLSPKDGPGDELKIYDSIHRQGLKTLEENLDLQALDILCIKSPLLRSHAKVGDRLFVHVFV